MPEYRHHRLLTDKTGRRYAKRVRALTLAALRESGRTPEKVRAMVGIAA
jgi:glutamyl-Q tRNA(Asp) synthetase